MKHSNANPDCESCALKLTQAHPTLKSWYVADVKPKHPMIHISWSYRDQASQEQAVADHKSQLHYPLSAHNKTDAQGNPCAQALDLFFLNEFGKAEFPQVLYAQIATEAGHSGAPILWGGVWKSIGDADHFQLNLPKTP